MSIMNEISVSIGAKLKILINKIVSLENYNNNRYNLSDYYIGFRPDYYRAVLPLCKLDNSDPNNFSYTSGRFDFIRTNGCCSELPMHIEIKMQKKYNSTTPEVFIMHNNLPDKIRPCTFTKNNIKYGGLELFYNVQAHNVYFIGISNLSDYESKSVYWKYLDTRDNSIVDTEINNSLEIL